MWGWYHQMWEKIREPSNVTKVQLHVMLVLHNVRMIPSNVRKNKGTTKCDKSIVICGVGTAQCENGTIECEKKIREPSNVTEVYLYVMLVLHIMGIILSNVRKK